MMFNRVTVKAGMMLYGLSILFFLAGYQQVAYSDVKNELKKISEEREKSVGYAKIAKITFKKQPKKLTQAMLYYTDAKSIGNPLIQHLQTSLTSRSMKESQLREMISDDVKRLVLVNEKFRMLIESGEVSTRGLPAMAAVASAAGPITDACVNLWKTYKDADQKKIDAMIQTLEAYKWDDWDKL